MRFIVLFSLISLFSCAKTNKVVLSIHEAEQLYLQALMQYGNPVAGYVSDGADAMGNWHEIEVIWYDSLQYHYLYYHFEKDEAEVNYEFKNLVAENVPALIQKTEIKGAGVRDLRCLNQKASIFLPLQFRGLDFNRSYSVENLELSSNWRLSSGKTSRKGRLYIESDSCKAELGLFNTGRIRRLKIQKVSQAEALRYLDTLIEHLGVFPKPCNWTYHSRDNIAFGAKSGDLFSLSAVFEKPYPAFRLFFTYRAHQQEIEIKLENTRPDYGRKNASKEFCVYGEGADKACEFLDRKAFQAKLKAQKQGR